MATLSNCVDNMLHLTLIITLFCVHTQALTPIYNGMLAEKQDSFILVPLHYENDAFEPYLSEETVELHYEKVVNYHRKEMNSMFKEWRELVSK